MSNRGGTRPGAGRKKGVPNKDRRAVIAKAKAGGIMPLQYMLNVMRDTKQPDARRDAMASAAAPYTHHRLATHQFQGDPGAPIYFIIKNRPPKHEK